MTTTTMHVLPTTHTRPSPCLLSGVPHAPGLDPCVPTQPTLMGCWPCCMPLPCPYHRHPCMQVLVLFFLIDFQQLSLDMEWYENQWHHFHRQKEVGIACKSHMSCSSDVCRIVQDNRVARNLVTGKEASVIYLKHSSVEIQTKEWGRKWKLYGSPVHSMTVIFLTVIVSRLYSTSLLLSLDSCLLLLLLFTHSFIFISLQVVVDHYGLP